MTEKKVKRNIILITVLAVLLVFALIVILVFQYASFWNLKTKEHNLQEQLKQLQTEHAFYEKEYEYKSSDEYIEDYAREVLGWGKYGSKYYK